jgi:hypothetical protein
VGEASTKSIKVLSDKPQTRLCEERVCLEQMVYKGKALCKKAEAEERERRVVEDK